jgi:pSer/pThr/pTyr-binding forkhead associated (FHA) protein
MPTLTIATGELGGKQFDLGGDRFTIGRSDTCSLVLGLSAVSVEHCAIFRRGGRYVIQDSGSTNGTLLNGSPVREALLKDGDRIGVGDIEMLFQDPAGAAQATASYPAFQTRKSTRWKSILTGLVVAAVVIMAALWFAMRLMNG